MRCSTFTRGLYEYEHNYLKEASQDQTFKGKVKTNLVGRALALGVSLVLHAEAVCRAAYVCFLRIQEIFSKPNNEKLLIGQKDKCCLAYDASLQSFFALFSLKALEKAAIAHSLATPPPQPPSPSTSTPQIIIIPATSSEIPPPPSIQPTAPSLQRIALPEQIDSQYFAAPSAAEEPFEPIQFPTDPVQEALRQPLLPQQAEDSFEEVEPPIDPVQEALHQPLPPQEAEDNFEEVEPPIDPVQEALHQPLPPQEAEDNFEEVEPPVDPVQEDLRQPMTSSAPLEAIEEFDLVDPEDADIAALLAEEPSSFTHQGVSPRTQAKRDIEELMPSAQSQIQPTPQEEFRIKMAEERLQNRKNGLAEEFRIRNEREVLASLTTELADAQKQLDMHNTHLVCLNGPEEHYDDPKWTILGERVGDYEIGICQYTKNERSLKPEYLSSLLDIRVGQTHYPLHLFAIFDPAIGVRASQYLKANLPHTLTGKIQETNPDRLSTVGIWNAISSTFLRLNHHFLFTYKNQKVHPLLDETIADHGSSATAAILFDQALWVAHLGSSRAILSNWNTPVQLTEDPDPSMEKYQSRVKKLGGFVNEIGLVNEKFDMATAFGHAYLKGAVSSMPMITRIPIDEIAVGSYLFLGTRGFFEATSTRQLASWLHTKKDLGARELAHDCTYSISRVKNAPLTSLLVKFNHRENEWIEV